MISKAIRALLAACLVTLLVVPAAARAEAPAAIETVLQLPPQAGHPRNSEGDFIALKDGRLLFVYSHFTGGGGDHDQAYLAGRYSSDGGRTWTDKDELIVDREGDWNVMSVSLLRLQNGSIGLFYLRKNSLTDCRPYLRISTDEAKTWSEPRLCIDEIGYYVLNNDRAEQLSSGRLVLPVCLHANEGTKFDPSGTIMCYLSDNNGQTWRRSKTERQAMHEGKRAIAQEPLVIELKDKRLLLLARSNVGSQLQAHSADGGETWTELTPSEIKSPVSPASIERLPKTGDLLMVWNDHSQIDSALKGKRTPLSAAISQDDGQTWQPARTLFDNPHGWYCYTAIEVVGDHVLLGHCAGDRRKNNGLAETHITRLPIAWLYE